MPTMVWCKVSCLYLSSRKAILKHRKFQTILTTTVQPPFHLSLVNYLWRRRALAFFFLNQTGRRLGTRCLPISMDTLTFWHKIPATWSTSSWRLSYGVTKISSSRFSYVGTDFLMTVFYSVLFVYTMTKWKVLHQRPEILAATILVYILSSAQVLLSILPLLRKFQVENRFGSLNLY